MLKIDFLGSGSAGNATLIRFGASCVLLDCGFGPRLLDARLRETRVRREQIDALLLTHEHKDHVAGLSWLSRQEGLKVVLTRRTAQALREGALLDGRSRCEEVEVQAGQAVTVGALAVTPFVTSHDAREPVGYVIRLPDGRRLGFATDMGYPNAEAIAALDGCDLLGVEANHDPEMLHAGPYPAFLKRRIRSDVGHLSNAAAARLVSRVASRRLGHLFLMHLSRTNNRPALARRVVQQRLDRMGLTAGISVVEQDSVLRYPPGEQLDLF